MMRIAKIVWLLLAGLTIGLSIAGLPIYYAQLQGPCVLDAATCSEQLLPTASELVQLQAQGWSAQQYARLALAPRTLQALILALIGVLIFASKPNDRGALLISLTLILFMPGDGRLAIGHAYPALNPSILVLDFIASVSLAFLLITFPDGRVVPRIMWLMIAYWLMMWVVIYLGLMDKANPWSLVISTVGWLGLLITSAGAQVYRYFRVSTLAQRQQTKWVVLGWSLFLVFTLVIALPALSDSSLTSGVSLHRLTFLLLINSVTLILPISIGIAILRSRLWDIDILIRRTLTYALVTALLVIAFFDSVVLLQQLFSSITGSGQNELVTVLSTLAIAALFVPVRNRVQSEIDKRFNRNKYNAQQVLQKFSELVRDETDLDKLTGGLIRVVDETMQPKSVSVWLKQSANEK